MILAHLSDLHLLALDGVSPHRFLNKRLTGWANLRLKRGAIHRASYVRAIAKEIARSRVDHVLVTGDLTNLALESEYALVRNVLRDDLALDPSRVTIVPGNHDVYTRGAVKSRRFPEWLGPWLDSDLPSLAVDVGGGRFPIVKLRDNIAIVGVTSAVPRPPFVAAGELGAEQLEALRRVLAHPEVASRTLVLALHHPVLVDWKPLKQYVEGLRDAPAVLALLRPLNAGLVVHGHLHRRVHRTMTTAGGRVDHIGATSASLHHVDIDRMAGFNVYDVGPGGLSSVEARVYDPAADAFQVRSVPVHS